MSTAGNNIYELLTTIKGSDHLAHDKLQDAVRAIKDGSSRYGSSEYEIARTTFPVPKPQRYAVIEIRKEKHDQMEILQQAKGLSSVEELLEVLIEEEVKRIEIDPFRPKTYEPYDEDEDEHLPF